MSSHCRTARTKKRPASGVCVWALPSPTLHLGVSFLLWEREVKRMGLNFHFPRSRKRRRTPLFPYTPPPLSCWANSLMEWWREGEREEWKKVCPIWCVFDFQGSRRKRRRKKDIREKGDFPGSSLKRRAGAEEKRERKEPLTLRISPGRRERERRASQK